MAAPRSWEDPLWEETHPRGEWEGWEGRHIQGEVALLEELLLQGGEEVPRLQGGEVGQLLLVVGMQLLLWVGMQPQVVEVQLQVVEVQLQEVEVQLQEVEVLLQEVEVLRQEVEVQQQLVVGEQQRLEVLEAVGAGLEGPRSRACRPRSLSTRSWRRRATSRPHWPGTPPPRWRGRCPCDRPARPSTSRRPNRWGSAR